MLEGTIPNPCDIVIITVSGGVNDGVVDFKLAFLKSQHFIYKFSRRVAMNII